MTLGYYELIQWKIVLLMHHYEIKLTLPMALWFCTRDIFNDNTNINSAPSYVANSCLPLIMLKKSRGKEKAQWHAMSQEKRDERDNMHQEPYHIKNE